ncbi:hypothetical protein H2509_14585 [Stappia sp. F7233]|uniref:DUF937 domain-containing protein n=1 Tax=Stappia albiluteola TaxID=2758565 RepID=A0A839AF72_9HYPH|nr:DUF937 domain-containing protein [Stappia albiluteola]MBA5778353.1 hypothetical protein [Stappia albiluteola]
MSDAQGIPLAFDPEALAALMREQFGWGKSDLLKASEALMSAALAGLRYNSSTPAGMQSLLAMMPGPAAARSAPSPESMFGEPLALFFGPESVQRAIVERIAQSTGLNPGGIETMMPVVATLTIGNFARQFVSGPARDMLDAFLAGYARGRPKPVPTPAEVMAPYTEAVQSFWDGYFRAVGSFQEAMAKPAPEQEVEVEDADDATEEAAPEEAASSEASEAAPPEPEANDRTGEASLADAWLALGRDIQESQIRTFENLFEQNSRG